MAEEDFKEYIRRQQEARQRAQQQYRQPISQEQFQQPQYYPQQPYPGPQYPQQPYPRPQQPTPQGAHSKFLILLLIVLGLIAVVVALLFIFGGREEEPAIPATPVTLPVTEEAEFSTTEFANEVDPEDLPGTLTITQIRFASDVRDDLSFDEVTDATFTRDEQPWIIFEVNNLASGGVSLTSYQTSYDEYIVVIGPDGRTVDDLTGFLGTTTETAEADTVYDFPIAHQLLTDESYATGEYEVTIFIDDLINGVEASRTGVFRIR